MRCNHMCPNTATNGGDIIIGSESETIIMERPSDPRSSSLPQFIAMQIIAFALCLIGAILTAGGVGLGGIVFALGLWASLREVEIRKRWKYERARRTKRNS